MKNWLPIRKVLTGLLAAGLLYAGRRAGLVDFGDAQANEAAQGLVGFVVAYVLPDPRVKRLEKKIGLVAKLRWLLRFAERETSLTPKDPSV